MQNKYMCETCATITCRGLLSRFGCADKYDDGKLSSKSLIYNRNWMSDIESPKLVLLYCSRLVRKTLGVFNFYAVQQRSAAAWQKQCILVGTFVRLWSALQLPYDHMCHQSTTRAKRDRRWGQALQLLKIGCKSPWWRHTLFSLVRCCDNKHEVCCECFILTINFQIMLTNLCFVTVKSFFSVVALFIFYQNTDKSIYTHTLFVFSSLYVYAELYS